MMNPDRSFYMRELSRDLNMPMGKKRMNVCSTEDQERQLSTGIQA
jgi:hypothetical protein